MQKGHGDTHQETHAEIHRAPSRGKRPPAIALRSGDFFENPSQRILIYRRKSQEPYVQHWHEFFEIAVIFSGRGEHVTGGYRHTVQSGDVLVINNRRAHGYEKTERLALVNILIREDLLFALAARLREIPGYDALFGVEAEPDSWWRSIFTGHVRLSRDDLRQVEAWIESIESELAMQQPSSFLLAEAYLALIIGLLARRYGQPPGRDSGRQAFEPLLHRVGERLDEVLSVADMARHAGMSERSFYRAFRLAMGISPKAYLQQMRLRKAAELLQEAPCPHQTITEVAQRVGFEDSNYFSRSFRRFFGVCPRRFRKGAGINAPRLGRPGSQGT